MEILELAGEPSSIGSLFFLTNRMNLNGVLGSRLITPRESFRKYYADLLQLAPRRVPLLTGIPGMGHLDVVTRERGSGSPVLIEFPAQLAGVADGVTDDGVLYFRAVRIADAKAIHFPDDRSLREHRARAYGNVHPHDALLRVTPELFSGNGLDVVVASPSGTPSPDWRRIDRIRGAASAAVNCASGSGQLTLAAFMLGATGQELHFELPSWLSWTELDDLVPTREASDSPSPDAVLFAAVYEGLAGFDIADTWSPGAVLALVVERVEASSLSGEDRQLVMRNLQRVKQLIDAEVDFEPFRSTASALTSAKALIMVLLRPNLGDLLAWPSEETGADDLTKLAAAVFAGRLRGVAREAAELRSVALDDQTAAWAVQVASEPTAPLGKVDIVWETGRVALVLGGVEVSTAPVVSEAPTQPAGSAELVALYEALSVRLKPAARRRVARVLGWPITTIVTLPPGAEVTAGSTLTVVSTEPVRFVESLDEQTFLELAADLSVGHLEAAVTALRARRRPG